MAGVAVDTGDDRGQVLRGGPVEVQVHLGRRDLGIAAIHGVQVAIGSGRGA